MDEKTKNILSWIIAIIVGIIVASFLFGDGCGCSQENAFTIESEEQTYTYDEYYTGNNLLPDKCPAVKLTIKNVSNTALHVYGEVNFYKDGALFETAYISSDTLAPGDRTVVTVSALNGVRWNTYENYNWTYKIIFIKANYS